MTQTQTQPPAITLEWIEEQEAFHERKLKSLAVLKTALLDVMTPEPNVGPEIPAKPAPSTGQKILMVAGKKKRTILRAISNSVIGLTTPEIVSACINADLPDTNQGNTSPQLSLYKSGGFIKLAGSRWVITDKGRAYLDAPKN